MSVVPPDDRIYDEGTLVIVGGEPLGHDVEESELPDHAPNVAAP